MAVANFVHVSLMDVSGPIYIDVSSKLAHPSQEVRPNLPFGEVAIPH